MGALPAACALVGALASATSLAQQRCDADADRWSTPTERFADNGDGTVTDRVARLVWMRCAVGQSWSKGHCTGTAQRLDWVAAVETAGAVNREGRWFFNDWRLPAARELASITERACAEPRANPQIFPDTPPDLFWTSTPRPGDGSTTRAYAMHFGAGGVMLLAKDEQAHLRLVRSGD